MRKLSKGIFNTPLLLLFLFITALFLIYSCKKSEVLPEAAEESLQKPASADPYKDKFFELSANVSPQVKIIAGNIKKHDAKNHFLKDFIKRVGYPKWDKAKIIKLGATTSRVNTETGAGEVVYVPFARDTDNYVNAVLAVKMEATDTVYRMLHAKRYKLFGYDTTDNTKWNARDAFHLFTVFDNSVFGHTKFLIKDTNLLKAAGATYTIATLIKSDAQNTTGRSTTTARIAGWITICGTYEVCGTEPEVPQNVFRLATILSCSSTTICSNYYFGDGGGSTGGSTGTGEGTGGGGGGSGGGTGGTTYYDDPCLTPTMRVSTGGNDCGTVGWVPVPTYTQTNIDVLVNKLTQNPSFLLNPCDYLDQWFALRAFLVPQQVKDKVAQADQAYRNNTNLAMQQYVQHPCYLQNIEDAASAVVNFDYFPIHITTLPTVNGVQWTAPQLFEYFRLHWNDFVNTDIAMFDPYQDQVINDAALWNSSNPLTAMLHLDMIDNGTVIISDFQSTQNQVRMKATTLRTYMDREHPVSGHREWGIIPDPNIGGYQFYTQAVDRVTGVLPTVFNT